MLQRPPLTRARRPGMGAGAPFLYVLGVLRKKMTLLKSLSACFMNASVKGGC